MRMIPSQISPDTASAAERQIFSWLAQIEDEGWSYALHSLNLSEHPYKRMGEVDFLVVGRRGIYVLEVKGGRVSHKDGIWTHTDRWGASRRKRESPFQQAQSAMFALSERLSKALPGRLSRAAFGYAVVLPDVDFTTESVEWDPPQVIDHSQLLRPGGLRRSLGAMAAYWQSKPGGRNTPIEDQDLDKILETMRPDFDAVLSLKSVIRGVEADVVRLTANQYRALDQLGRSERVVFEGGAGTGKTLLAVEACRRAARQGHSVLFTCVSPHMANFASRQEGMGSVRCLPFDRLALMPDERFDVLIVDEAQDLISFDALGLLDVRVANGLQDGRWSMFMDSNNQRGLVGSYEPDAMHFVELIRPAFFRLDDNCRNTRQIAEQTSAATGADVGVSLAGTGPEVAYIRGAEIEELVIQVDRYLVGLLDDGVEPSDIVLLSSEPFEESIFSRLPPSKSVKISLLDVLSSVVPAHGRMGFSTIADFKGLESRFVVLDEAPSLDRTTDLANLYVGMTRARVGLCVIDRGPR